MPSAQNIYDAPSFFVGYEKLRHMAIGLNEVLEPANPEAVRQAPRLADCGAGRTGEPLARAAGATAALS
jgi:hypothetical protein